MKTNVKNIDVKATTFKAVKLVTGPIHLATTLATIGTAILEAKTGEALGQGSFAELANERIDLTTKRVESLEAKTNQWMSKFKEIKERRELNLETK